MSAYFTDSSAAAKRYLTESGSIWVKSLFAASSSHEFFAVATTSVEVVAAITRRAHGKTILHQDAVAFCSLFLSDFDTDFQIIAVTDILLRQAIYLARVYALRGYDAVQLAAANEANHLRVAAGLPPLVFLSADNELNTAAIAEGLVVDNPNTHL